MTVLLAVISNVEDRYRGFLSSHGLEVAPSVFFMPVISSGVRDRVIDVVRSWHEELGNGSILFAYPKSGGPGAMCFVWLGRERRDLVEHEGLLLLRRE